MDHDTTDAPNSDEIEIISEAPEQKATHKWEFKGRQAQKWGRVTKQGLIVGRAPNQKVVSPDEVYMLASLHCTIREMSEWFEVNESTLKYNFNAYILKAQEETKQRLRAAQIKAALGGNVAMLIWLGKNMLGQSENPAMTDTTKILPWTDD